MQGRTQDLELGGGGGGAMQWRIQDFSEGGAGGGGGGQSASGPIPLFGTQKISTCTYLRTT